AMARHVKIDGVIAAQEIAPVLTGARAHPTFPLAERVNGWIAAAFAGAGGNFQIGVELGRRFAEAGLQPARQPIVETVCALGGSDVAALRFRMLLASLLPVLVERQIATEREIDLATFEERFRAEARATNSTVVLWSALVGWWAHRVRE